MEGDLQAMTWIPIIIIILWGPVAGLLMAGLAVHWWRKFHEFPWVPIALYMPLLLGAFFLWKLFFQRV